MFDTTVAENTTIDLYFDAPEETFIPQTFEVLEFTDVKSPIEAPEQTNMSFAPWCVMEDVIFNSKVKNNQLYGYYRITVF